jgi:diaminopimelate epimerase
MNIHFWKMHGAANDFILVDDRSLKFPVSDRNWIKTIAARRTGVGSEGVLLIQPSSKADFRMRFFNPDGGEADLCGNGGRCIARLAYEINAAPATMSIETPVGIVRAEVLDEQVLLRMPDPKDWRVNRILMLDNQSLNYSFVNTGVPHAVIHVENLETIDVQKMGSQIRYHTDFGPSGTNANFIQVTGLDSLRVRTYERGVEGETLACGTGMTACGLIASKLGLTHPPVIITSTSGDRLEVNFELTPDSARHVTLLGPAVHVFHGELYY